MDRVVLSLNNICKSYDELSILKGVNLNLHAGEITSIMGPSGVGKSTMLHVAGLMDKPTDGDVIIDGVSTKLLDEEEQAKMRLKKIGFLFQFHYLLSDFNVMDNVLIPARLANNDLTIKRQEAEALLGKLGLSERLTHYPDHLSGGEQQRVALARALIQAPDILLCDEPTGNLDHHSALAMMNLISGYVSDRKMAALIVTHNENLNRYAHHSFVLLDGELKTLLAEVRV